MIAYPPTRMIARTTLRLVIDFCDVKDPEKDEGAETKGSQGVLVRDSRDLLPEVYIRV
jgi:hypothetical protein